MIKERANANYEEVFSLAVRHGKMTEDRKAELLAKIDKVQSNDDSAHAGYEMGIRVYLDDSAGSSDREIIVDLGAHCIMTDEDEADHMEVCYATSKSYLKKASL